MVSRKYVVKNFTYLGLEEIQTICQKAKEYEENIYIEYKNQRANLKSVLELYHLELKPQSEIVLKILGKNPFFVLDEFDNYFKKISE